MGLLKFRVDGAVKSAPKGKVSLAIESKNRSQIARVSSLLARAPGYAHDLEALQSTTESFGLFRNVRSLRLFQASIEVAHIARQLRRELGPGRNIIVNAGGQRRNGNLSK